MGNIKCGKCGHDIPEGVIVCSYCGHSVPKAQLSEETKKTLKENERSDESLKPNTGCSIRLLGIILMVLGGLCDVVCMALVGTGSFESFRFFTIAGTVCFGLGLFLTFAFR